MANRALAAKVERASKEGRAAAAHEFGKAFYARTPCDRTREHEELAAQVAKFLTTKSIHRVACEGRKVEHARGGFVADRSTIAPGKAIRCAPRYYGAPRPTRR